jgi:thymidylate synthase (FAD)
VHVDEHINTPEQEIHDYIDLLVGWYNWAAEQGLAAEQARMILPQNLYTQFYMSGNLRAWAHFLNLRLDPHAQKECRDIAQQCHDLIEPAFPVSLKALMESEC